MPPVADLAALCGPIELLVLDVDGVLTDGIIALDDAGLETKHFHVRDGAGITFWLKAGKRVAVLSGRSAAVVDRRAAELGIAPVIQGVSEKRGPFRTLMAEMDLEPRQVCFMGDDLPDLPALALAGLAACPADASREVLDSVHLVASHAGGRGAVREIIEVILKHQGAWDRIVANFGSD